MTEQQNLGSIAFVVFALVLPLHAGLYLAPGRMQGWKGGGGRLGGWGRMGRNFMVILTLSNFNFKISTKLSERCHDTGHEFCSDSQNGAKYYLIFFVFSIFMSGPFFPASK